MNQINIQYLKSPFGELILGSFEEKLCLCDWRYRKMLTTIDKRIQQGLGAGFVEQKNDVLETTRQQLKEYFARTRNHFEIPIITVGTDFQKIVWKELVNVTFGSISTYLQLAEKIENKKSVRAVANANAANAISIIIPCHRIIGSNGKLTGYAGGIKVKEKLLALENHSFAE